MKTSSFPCARATGARWRQSGLFAVAGRAACVWTVLCLGSATGSTQTLVFTEPGAPPLIRTAGGSAHGFFANERFLVSNWVSAELPGVFDPLADGLGLLTPVLPGASFPSKFFNDLADAAAAFSIPDSGAVAAPRSPDLPKTADGEPPASPAGAVEPIVVTAPAAATASPGGGFGILLFLLARRQFESEGRSQR